MKTLKIYLVSASFLIAGVAFAQQGSTTGKGGAPGKDKGKDKGKGSTQMAIKNQGAPSKVAKSNDKKADVKPAKTSK